MSPILAAADPLSLDLTALEWGAVVLASAIIFAIIGKRLWRDVRGWLGQDG